MKGADPDLEILAGFHEDCDELVRRSLESETLNYQVFCNIWKDMNFAKVFHGRVSGADMAEFSEEAIFVAKRYMFADTNNYEIKVAGLFLVYGLVNLQPYASFAKLRLTPADVPLIHRLADTARSTQRLDVVYILGSLLTSPGTEYHIAEREYGLDGKMRKQFIDGPVLERGMLSRSVLHLPSEERQLARELAALEQRYIAAKKQINGRGTLDRTLQYAARSLGNELERTLGDVVARRHMSYDDDEPGSLAEGIKERAMRQSVGRMRHLVSVQERPVEPPAPVARAIEPLGSPTKSETRANSGIKTESPNKPMQTSRKRGKTRKNIPAKRKKVGSSKSNDTAEVTEGVTVAQLLDRATSGDQAEVLPILIRKDDGDYIEIELIDEYNKPAETQTSAEGEVELIMPDVGVAESAAQKTEKEEAPSDSADSDSEDVKDVVKKKLTVRSTLIRYGLLDVAGEKDEISDDT